MEMMRVNSINLTLLFLFLSFLLFLSFSFLFSIVFSFSFLFFSFRQVAQTELLQYDYNKNAASSIDFLLLGIRIATSSTNMQFELSYFQN